jgi:hypothetical protein
MGSPSEEADWARRINVSRVLGRTRTCRADEHAGLYLAALASGYRATSAVTINDRRIGSALQSQIVVDTRRTATGCGCLARVNVTDVRYPTTPNQTGVAFTPRNLSPTNGPGAGDRPAGGSIPVERATDAGTSGCAAGGSASRIYRQRCPPTRTTGQAPTRRGNAATGQAPRVCHKPGKRS